VNNIDLMGLAKIEPMDFSNWVQAFTPGGWGGGSGHVASRSPRDDYYSTTTSELRDRITFEEWYEIQNDIARSLGLSSYEEARQYGYNPQTVYIQGTWTDSENTTVSIDGVDAISLFQSVLDGFTITLVQIYGVNVLISSFGDLGGLTFTTYGVLADNPTAAAFLGFIEIQGNNIDWAGVTNATLNVVGGLIEMGIGGGSEFFTGGTSSAVSIPLIVDGGVRVVTNFTRLLAYSARQNIAGNAIPGNIGAILGKGIDLFTGVPINQYGYGQCLGGVTNNFLSFVVTGGNGSSFSLPTYRSAIFYGSAYGGYTNSLYNDISPLKK
jgi:hypothetical protein